MLKRAGVLEKALVIAPLRVLYLVWPAEREKWADFHGLRMVLLHGPGKDLALEKEADIYLINPEGLEWLFKPVKQKYQTRAGATRVRVAIDVARWRALGIETLIIDELTKFKNINSIRFKMMKQIIPLFQRRWGLTGSIAANGLIQLFGQCFILDEGRALGRFITHFRNKHFDLGYDGFSWTLKPDGEKQIYERVAPLALRMAAEDYIAMPKLIPNDIKIELPPAAMKIYKQLEDDLFVKMDERKVTAANAGVASMKCRQVANGFLYLDQEVEALVKLPERGKREVLELHTEKADALANLVESLQGNQIFIGYYFDYDLQFFRRRLEQLLEIQVPHFGKGLTRAEMQKVEKDWNEGRTVALLAQMNSAAHGLNLQDSSCRHVAVVSPIPDFEVFDQFTRRVRRQGNKAQSVTVHHIYADVRVERATLGMLRGKDKTQRGFHKAMQEMRED